MLTGFRNGAPGTIDRFSCDKTRTTIAGYNNAPSDTYLGHCLGGLSGNGNHPGAPGLGLLLSVQSITPVFRTVGPQASFIAILQVEIGS
jgi:hypothetical protein